MVVGEPVGVAGERGFLRQRRHPGQQRGGRVGQQVIDVGNPPGAGELEREQGQQPRCGGDDRGAGVAGCGGQRRQVQDGQVGQDQQQPGPGGLQPGRPGGEVDHLRARQVGVPAGRARADAGLRLGAADQPAEPFLGEDLTDARAVERPALGGQPRGDLVGRQALPAQLDHPAPGAVLRRRGARRRAVPPRRREQVQLPCPVLAHQVDHRPPGVAEPGPGLLIGQPVDIPGPQRLIPALVHLLRRDERLRPRALRRSGCHMLIMPHHLPGDAVARRRRRTVLSWDSADMPAPGAGDLRHAHQSHTCNSAGRYPQHRIQPTALAQAASSQVAAPTTARDQAWVTPTHCA